MIRINSQAIFSLGFLDKYNPYTHHIKCCIKKGGVSIRFGSQRSDSLRFKNTWYNVKDTQTTIELDYQERGNLCRNREIAPLLSKDLAFLRGNQFNGKQPSVVWQVQDQKHVLKREEAAFHKATLSLSFLLSYCATQNQIWREKQKAHLTFLGNSSISTSYQGRNDKRKESYISSRVSNVSFLIPRQYRQEMNGHALRRAIAKIRPCIDLRHVRRGRKVFSIPRIIPPFKRSLFGMRGLLSVLYDSRRTNNNDRIVRRGNLLSSSKEKSRERNSAHAYIDTSTPLLSSGQGLSENQALSTLELRNVGFQSTETTPYLERAKDKQDTKTLIDLARRFPYTRATGNGKDNKKYKTSTLSLSLTLGKEIKASFQSRSRAIDNKKRTYRVASANRGSIRMSWWM